jgi:Cu(I)/Ag(I) efflux system membrane fusion protein
MKKPAVIGSLLLFVALAYMAGKYSGRSDHASNMESGRVLYYVDPMHPAYRSDRPGIAPDCGMPLVPVHEGDDLSGKLKLPPGAVYIAPERQNQIGVRVEAIKKNSGSRVIRTIGHVEADGNLINRMMAGTDGWVESLQDTPPGAIVKKNQLLATLYSREFRNAEQAYLGSLGTLDRLKGTHEFEDNNKSNDASLRLNEEQLRALGMGQPQIQELAKTRKITENVTLTSPVDGIVLDRDISPGQRFQMGSQFYRIADLSKVWIVADIYGNEGAMFHPGAKVRVTLREQAKSFYATVGDTPPSFDPATRTLKLRLEAQNPDLVLRPDMYVDLEFNASAPSGLGVPQEAVLDSGMQKIVYVETSDGVFEPRRVTLGTAYGDFITVTSGLVAGDRVAISGNFLIDSESRMHSSGMSSLNGKPDVPGKIQASVITPLSESPEKHLQKLQAMQITAGVEVDTLTRTPGAPRGARRGAND